MNFLICGGGTGGHISPACALYKKLRSLDCGAKLVVLPKDKSYLQDDIERIYINVKAPVGAAGKLSFIFSFAIALLKSIGVIIKEKPKAVVGVGGYVSVPMLSAAILTFTPIYICEQNSFAGKANRLFAIFAKSVFHTFEASKGQIKKGIVCGNPVRPEFFSINKDSAREKLGYSKDDKLLLITGGSQGARHLNQIIMRSLPEVFKEYKNLKAVWITGKSNYDEVRVFCRGCGFDNVNVLDYSNDMPAYIHAADFAISRAGSSTISEMTAAKLPALFVPYPYATDDHQYYNAKELADKEAAMLIREEELDKNAILLIMSWAFGDYNKLQKMRENIAALNRADAAHTIADILIDKR